MYRMTDEEFEAAIEAAIDAMPQQFLDALQNVAIVWEEEPNAYHLGYDEDEWDTEEPLDDANENDGDEASGAETCEEAEGESLPDDLLGLFDGLSLVERAGSYDDDIPDVITVFKGPTSAVSTAARKSWKRSAKPSSTSWATISGLPRSSWPQWDTSKGIESPCARPCSPFSERELAALSGQQITRVFGSPCQNVVVEALLPIDVVDALLHLVEKLNEPLALGREHHLTLGNADGPLQAQFEVLLHFSNAHIAALQARQTLDPLDVALVEDAPIVRVALYMGHKPLIAVEPQPLVGKPRRLANLLHGIKLRHRLGRSLSSGFGF